MKPQFLFWEGRALPHQPMLNAPHVLKPETLAKVEKMPMLAQEIADRWASGWPARVRKMDREGTFLDRLTKQAEREREILANPNLGHLAHHEIMELYGLNPDP